MSYREWVIFSDRQGRGAAIVRALGRLRERERERRELAMMRPRDFGDLPLSPTAVRDETRRRWWQRLDIR